jgi:MarR family multiple antibiotic resistance transcriptional regulator
MPQRIRRLYLLQAAAINESLKEHGLARSQWQVLSHVSAAGTLSQKELQCAMQVEPATLTGIVDSLAGKGWLERLENPQDKRGKLLRLTAEGTARWERIPDVVARIERCMLVGVSAEDRRALERVVDRMIANLQERPKDKI